MALEVSLKSNYSMCYVLYSKYTGVVDGDYQGVTDEIIIFEAGDVTQTHRIIFNNDIECEKEPNENFFSNIALNRGISDIFVTEPRATVTIDDTAEPECGRCHNCASQQ